MTPIERAARAMLDSNRVANGLKPDAGLSDMTPQAQADYLRQVRAVIAAIREPSDAMTLAGRKAAAIALHRDGGYRMEDTWSAMIDAALVEGA